MGDGRHIKAETIEIQWVASTLVCTLQLKVCTQSENKNHFSTDGSQVLHRLKHIELTNHFDTF